MSALQPRVDEYLAIRRSLGYKLAGHGTVLLEFVGWLDHRGATVITADLALAWAQSRPTSSPVRERQRLTTVRRFAEYMHAIDPGPRCQPRICCQQRSSGRLRTCTAQPKSRS